MLIIKHSILGITTLNSLQANLTLFEKRTSHRLIKLRPNICCGSYMKTFAGFYL